MRFKFKPKEKPTSNSVKTVNKFLWFPMTLGNELRWLERATIKYAYIMQHGVLAGSGRGFTYYSWVPRFFVD